MGNSFCLCCGRNDERVARRHVSQHSTMEPLLRDSEKEAVSIILSILDSDVITDSKRMSADKMQSLWTLAFSDNVDLQKSAALCFSEISDTWVEPVNSQFLEPILHLLTSQEVEVQKAASLALSNLALKGPVENKVTIVKAGALPSLIMLLAVDNTEVQCNACGCITTLATTDENKREIVVRGAIPPLLKLTSITDPRVQRNAAGALLNLTHNDANREELVQCGAVPVFIKLLDSRDPDVQFYSAAGLSNLAVHESHRNEIATYNDSRAIKVLVSLMRSTSEKVQCQACLAIRNLASDEVNQEAIVQHGGLEALIPLFDSSDMETIIAAVAALRNLSIRRGNETAIIQNGALLKLRQLLFLHDYPEIQCHSAGTIRNLAAEDQFVPIIESGCLAALAERLKDGRGPREVLSETSAALAVMASHVGAREKMMSFFNGNFHKVLLNLTRSPHKDIQYNAAGTIGHLAIIEDYHHILLHNESSSTTEFITKFLQSSDPSFVHLSLWVVAQFSSGSKRTRALIRNTGLMKTIDELRTNKKNLSLEIVQLAEATYHNLQQ